MEKFKPRPMRAHNGYDTQAASEETWFDNSHEPSNTIQSHAIDADINVIMERFGVTGRLPENPRIPMYGDFTGVKDYRTALEAVQAAHNNFMELPAKIRAEFENDPQTFLDFAQNPENIDRLRELGLAKPKPPAPSPGPDPAPAPAPKAPDQGPPQKGTT